MFGDLSPLFPYMRRYRWGYVRGVLACVSTNTVAVLFPTVLGMAVDAIKNGTTRRHILFLALSASRWQASTFLQPAIDAVGKAALTTIEGIGNTPLGARLQKAWLDVDVVQCGYCQGGQIMSAAALLARTPVPNDNDIQSAMNGNLCRCGTYLRIQEAIKQAAKADLDSAATKKGT